MVASLLVGAWAAPQRPNGWVFDSTPGKTLNELNELRFESSRDHRARTDRSPVIGLSSTAQPGVDASETGVSTLETPAGAVKSVVVCVLG